MSEEEKRAAETPFEDHLSRLRGLIADPNYVVRVMADSPGASSMFGTDFTRELVRCVAPLDPANEALVEAGAIAAAANELRDEWPDKSLEKAWLLTRERTREYWRNRVRETIAALQIFFQKAAANGDTNG